MAWHLMSVKFLNLRDVTCAKNLLGGRSSLQCHTQCRLLRTHWLVLVKDIEAELL